MHLIVLEFAKRLVNCRNFSKSTIETYIRAINALDDYLKECEKILEKLINENNVSNSQQITKINSSEKKQAIH